MDYDEKILVKSLIKSNKQLNMNFIFKIVVNNYFIRYNLYIIIRGDNYDGKCSKI